MSDSQRHLTSLDFDRLELGPLVSSVEVVRARGHLKSCASCSARQAEHASAVAQFRSTVFPRTAPELCGPRPALRGGFRAWMLALAFPAVAVFPLLVHLSRSPAGADQQSSGEDLSPLGIKGTAALHVFARLGGPAAQVPGTVVKVLDGTRLAAGDALRFVLDPTGLSYVLIASVDGAGQVSIYYPYRGESSARVDGRATVSVPDSIVLDHALGPERVFALFSSDPIPAGRVRQALASTAAAGASAIRSQRHLPIEGTVQATVVFEKEPTP